MTAIFLPSTRMCGYYTNSVCLNCYAYGAGGPCINCIRYEGLLVGPVDWEEFRVGLDLPVDYQEFLNNPSPNNHYVNIEMFPPPNGTWEDLLQINDYNSLDIKNYSDDYDYDDVVSVCSIDSDDVNVFGVVHDYVYDELSDEITNSPGPSTSSPGPSTSSPGPSTSSYTGPMTRSRAKALLQSHR